MYWFELIFRFIEPKPVRVRLVSDRKSPRAPAAWCQKVSKGVKRCQKGPSHSPIATTVSISYRFHTDFGPIFPAYRTPAGLILDRNSCARAQNLGQKWPSWLPKVGITDVCSPCFRRETALGMFENLTFRLKPGLPTWDSTTLDRPWHSLNARKYCLSAHKISVF
jgi:hypothetical protein